MSEHKSKMTSFWVTHIHSFPIGDHTFVVQLEQPADHNQDMQTGQYTLAESCKTGKQLEQQPPQQQEHCHNHRHHNPGLTGSSYAL